jgi:hypothetical protein
MLFIAMLLAALLSKRALQPFKISGAFLCVGVPNLPTVAPTGGGGGWRSEGGNARERAGQ